MALRKEEGADLRKQYPLYVEIGLVLSLTLLIVAFRADFSNESSFQVQMEEQETVDMKQIQQTQQEKEPPPPPKPPVPQEVPNNEVIENETDFDASLDMDERLDTSQGPPDDGEEEEEEEQEIFMVVENQPELVGGMRALQQSVEYPEFAKKAGIEAPDALDRRLNDRPGVLDHGLFLDMATDVLVGRPDESVDHRSAS